MSYKIKSTHKTGTVIKKTKKYFIAKTLDSNIKILEWFGSVKKGDKFEVYDAKH